MRTGSICSGTFLSGADKSRGPHTRREGVRGCRTFKLKTRPSSGRILLINCRVHLIAKGGSNPRRDKSREFKLKKIVEIPAFGSFPFSFIFSGFNFAFIFQLWWWVIGVQSVFVWLFFILRTKGLYMVLWQIFENFSINFCRNGSSQFFMNLYGCCIRF